MFELSVALKYLLPRRRQLSVSIISLISVLVIALVVWLIVIFFSVSNGLEKHWISRLVALTSPVRITPTDTYYNSYYFNVDTISEASNFTAKSIGDKLRVEKSDPYDPYNDPEAPNSWLPPHLDADGHLVDPVKELFKSIDTLKPHYQGLYAKDFDSSFANLRLQLLRRNEATNALDSGNQTYLTQAVIVSSLDASNPALKQSLLPITTEDLWNLLSLSSLRGGMEQPYQIQTVKLHRDRIVMLPETFAKKILREFDTMDAIGIMDGDHLVQLLVPLTNSEILPMIQKIESAGFRAASLNLYAAKGQVRSEEGVPIPSFIPVSLNVATPLAVKTTRQGNDLQFWTSLSIQSETVPLKLMLDQVEIEQFADTRENRLVLEPSPDGTEEIFLPRPFKDAGILVGDRGTLSYYAPSATSVQEQHLQVAVAGFYDPGLIPVGGKLVLARPEITSLIQSAHSQNGQNDGLGNGVHVNFTHLDEAESIQQALENQLRIRGIDAYWKIETFRNYDFTRVFLQQMKSDKNLFLLIATIIIIVACSNIISMLIILINDKKLEIGILRSMGATGKSIAAIFGTCGLVMGLLGSAVGILAAIFTLQNLDALIGLISLVQGHDMFNPTFYGKTLPKELSGEALAFVLIATSLLSLTSGIIPAIKACRLNPSTILRSE